MIDQIVLTAAERVVPHSGKGTSRVVDGETVIVAALKVGMK